MDGSSRASASRQPQLLDRQALDAEQGRRLRRARRTALIAGVVAASFFVFSIAQLFWVQHLGLH